MKRHPVYVIAGYVAATVSLSLAAIGVSQAEVFLDAYTKAQPVIDKAVNAYGGPEKIGSIETFHIHETTKIRQRYQSRKLGPPFDIVEGSTDIAFDRANGHFRASFGGPFPTMQIRHGDESQQIDLTRMVSTPAAAPIDQNTHFINRIVPALLANKLYQRAQNVTWAGQSRINDRLNDVLSIAWDTGQMYMVHVDSETGLIRRYDILANDFVVGDTIAESYFDEYETIDGIPTPMHRWQRMAGQQTYDAYVQEISYNGDVSSQFEIPEGVIAVDAAPPPASELRELTAGVWIGNGAYQNLYVDMGDYLLSVDAGGGTAVIKGDLAQLESLADGKPLRYSVITHHHSDHTAGVDALAAAGTTFITTADSREYLTGIIASRSTAGANATTVEPVTPKFETVKDRDVVESATRRVEIYRVPNAHAEDYFIVYLPAEKILFGADVFNFPPNGPAAPANENFQTFWDNFSKLGLDVETVANAHGRLGTADELRTRAGKRLASR
ncbi:MAG: MBL fold metallo-hydrolase [Gammaproteobacteria bacterium]|nr:MAG: MBL fold metallo-hydrolase [Gammaproteobacteria bacterium]